MSRPSTFRLKFYNRSNQGRLPFLDKVLTKTEYLPVEERSVREGRQIRRHRFKDEEYSCDQCDLILGGITRDSGMKLN